MTQYEDAVARPVALAHGQRTTRHIQPQLALPILGVGFWAYGLSQIQASRIGNFGLLASADIWFVLGLAALVVGFVLELRRGEPRGWLLGLQLVALIVAIESTVPILFGVPEYAWVYKHIGIASAFQEYGRVTDPTNIYQQWPALFAAVAAIGSLAHLNALSFAAWAPLAFELAGALLLLAVFRLLTGDRRIAWLAVLLYEGLICWVGQDYLSPQAFGYLLWLAMVLIIVRWLRAPASSAEPRGRLARLRAPLVAGLRPPAATTKAMRAVAVAMVATIYFAIVAAHQLTPYAALAGVGALTALDLVRPRWLLVLMAAIAGAYLAPRYNLIAHDFGGLFSGGNPIQNASGPRGTYHAGGKATTALIERGLAGCMWLSALAAVACRRRALGRVAIPAALAFSPFLILGAQSYGGEAIDRVFLFSAPWCALLIAGALCELRLPLRWPLIGGVCLAGVFAGVQGLYGPVHVDGFTPAELTASRWLYGHIPHGSLIVLPQENFPTLETADYSDYQLRVMPADPQIGTPWMNEGDLTQVERWFTHLGQKTAYIVVSRSMNASVGYYGSPKGYAEFVRAIPTAFRGIAIYHNDDATIYRLNLAGNGANAHPRYTKLAWSDEFNGPAAKPPAASRWIHDIGAWGHTNKELETYTNSPANASLDGQGHLAIVARRHTETGPYGRTKYTSARLETQGLFSATYGLVEARMKIPAGTGLWPAFWMLGNDIKTAGWPASGEIDVLEALGQHPAVAHGFINGPSGGASHYTVGRSVVSATSLASGFHTYAIRWSRNSITWLLDGVPYGTTTPQNLPPGARWVFNRPFHLLLNLAVGGDWGGPPNSSTRLPATLLVDWVRVYQ
jgi:beta-glucanase (GH16 family)